MSDTTTSPVNAIPSVMQAAQQKEYGEARNVLSINGNVPVPQELSSDQILVRVSAASINPVDWKLLNGKLSAISRYTFPHTPGSDVAGTVVSIGSGVKRFKVGDQVYGNVGINGGAFAEYVRGKESMFALKPNNLTMDEAAAIPLACETSYQALFQKLSPPVGFGTKLFVCGGSTATGLFAIQLAKAAGAQVAATCSERNISLLKRLGFNTTQNKEEFTIDKPEILLIDYTTKDFGEELKGDNYDFVYDCVGGENNWISAKKILKQGGEFITIVGDDPDFDLAFKPVFTLGSNIISRKIQSVFTSERHGYSFHVLSQTPEDLDELRKQYIETGKVKPIIDTVYNWKDDGVDALFYLYDKSKVGKPQGKLVLRIAD